MCERVGQLVRLVALVLLLIGTSHLDGGTVVLAADFRAPNYNPTLELREFATLEDYSEATGQDRNSVQVGYDVFVNVPALDARDVSMLQAVYDADDLDFRVRPGSAAVDRGLVLPTVTDGFTGSAPDLGALEVGVAAPHYGPRP